MIKLENVSKNIKGKTVIDGITQTFHGGITYGLKGINGSGKTMLMRLVSGLIYPTSGRIEIRGKELGKDMSFPDDLGLLIENPAFLDSYTGFDNLWLLATLNNRAGKTEVKEALLRTGLDPEDRRKYKKYSLGMKQRLGIAAAIMEKPQILILDEPLNALDTEGVALFDKIIREEQERGTLIILSCHEEKKLHEYADVILTLENGKIKDREEL